MPFEFRYDTVCLSTVFSGDDAYRITTDTEPESLLNTIKRVGLINPPILFPERDGHTIVCGHRRVSALRKLGLEETPARILPENTAPLTCATLAICDNIADRPLNHIELSRAFSLLLFHSPSNEVFLEIANAIGLPDNPALIKKLLPLCTLPQALQQGIVSGTLALPSALMLSKFPSELATDYAVFLTSLKLSLHKQKEVIELIQEIASIEGVSIKHVLNAPDIANAFHDPEMDTPRKAGLIRDYLRKRRFPHLSQAQAEFDHLKSGLKFGDHTDLKAPAGFESNRYTLTMSFSSTDELEKSKQHIENMLKNDQFIHFLSDRDPSYR